MHIEREELIILLRVVLLLHVRLYFIFGYVRSQKVEQFNSEFSLYVK